MIDYYSAVYVDVVERTLQLMFVMNDGCLPVIDTPRVGYFENIQLTLPSNPFGTLYTNMFLNMMSSVYQSVTLSINNVNLEDIESNHVASIWVFGNFNTI